jgi:IPT/TIG domain
MFRSTADGEKPDPKGVAPMRFRTCGVSFACLLVLSLAVLLGCNNTLNPLCGSARPAPLIGSLSPSTVSFAQVQQGTMLTVNGNNFVSSSELLVNSTPLGVTVVSDQQLKVKLTTGVISGPGQVKVQVQTPSGNSGDLGCTSGGKSSVLILTVN